MNHHPISLVSSKKGFGVKQSFKGGIKKSINDSDMDFDLELD